MRRRAFLGTTASLVGLAGATPVAAADGPRGSNNGDGAKGARLVNAEESDGTIVATDDGFVIRGQEVVVDSGVEYGIDTAGYSGVVADNRISGTSDPGGDQIGISAGGGDVQVERNRIDVPDDYAHQFVGVSFTDGAGGSIRGNEIVGFHRAGILVRGAGTSATVRGNTVSGTGKRTIGWAENGIQVDRGASVRIQNNAVEGHWWDGKSNFASTGISLFGVDESGVVNNTLSDNEFGVYVAGRGNRVNGNDVANSFDSDSTFEFVSWGVLAAGSNNHLAGNRIADTSVDGGGAGIYLLPGASENKLTGNRISGFESNVIDATDESDENLIKGNPSPAS